MRCFFAGQSGPDGLPFVDYVRADGEPDTGPFIDPAVLAEMAFGELGLSPINIGMAPEPASDSLGLVGLPVWMWADSPSPETVGPAGFSISAGPVNLTLTARVERIVWDMGDGTSVTCTTTGTPYEARFGAIPSPDCGHVYSSTSADQAGGAFSVTARSYWVAEWTTNTGLSGTMERQQTATEQVRIGESQVIVTRD